MSFAPSELERFVAELAGPRTYGATRFGTRPTCGSTNRSGMTST